VNETLKELRLDPFKDVIALSWLVRVLRAMIAALS
jgi:hypothetical protein